MSTATRVPETWVLDGDDARAVLADTGRPRLLVDAFERLRSADGSSHSRSLAFMISLVLMQGLIVIVGIAAALGDTGVSKVVVDAIEGAAPGPSGDVLRRAVEQARTVGGQGRGFVLAIGLIGLTITATTAMGQLERGLNRIYGIERDRPFARKYRRALLLAVTVGTVLTTSFVLMAFGRHLGAGRAGVTHDVWLVVRWPVAIGLLGVGLALLFDWAPNRRQPGRAWLAFGSTVAVGLCGLSTLGLALAFRLSSSFGQTYGPLAGIVALQLWAMLTALSVFYGAAVAAELESVRAGLVGVSSRSRPASGGAPIGTTG